MAYYEAQRDAGVPIDSRAFEPDFAEHMRVGYPFHPELIRLFAERWPISLSSRPRVAPSAGGGADDSRRVGSPTRPQRDPVAATAAC